LGTALRSRGDHKTVCVSLLGIWTGQTALQLRPKGIASKLTHTVL
jgi:hypothetical protein